MENRPGYGVSDYFPDKIRHQVFFFGHAIVSWPDMEKKCNIWVVSIQYLSVIGLISFL